MIVYHSWTVLIKKDERIDYVFERKNDWDVIYLREKNPLCLKPYNNNCEERDKKKLEDYQKEFNKQNSLLEGICE